MLHILVFCTCQLLPFVVLIPVDLAEPTWPLFQYPLPGLLTDVHQANPAASKAYGHHIQCSTGLHQRSNAHCLFRPRKSEEWGLRLVIHFGPQPFAST